MDVCCPRISRLFQADLLGARCRTRRHEELLRDLVAFSRRTEYIDGVLCVRNLVFDTDYLIEKG